MCKWTPTSKSSFWDLQNVRWEQVELQHDWNLVANTQISNDNAPGTPGLLYFSHIEIADLCDDVFLKSASLCQSKSEPWHY